MARIAIVGGNGLTARHLISRLSGRGDEVVATIRDAAQSAAIVALGAKPVVLDLERSSVEDYAEAFRGSEAVVFAAGVGGSGGDVDVVDRQGSVKSVDAAKAAGVTRFVQISAIGSSGGTPPSLTGPFWEAYYAAKRAGDAYLRDSGLQWTILEPGALTEELATDGIELGVNVSSEPISRADVAATVAAVLDEPASSGFTWELVGGEASVVDAVRRAAGL
ncbi:NAD-dependent dehydratase [Frondihabitans sucicola]|uniref:NAD-dependent dehydratase n=1 Tax=Frondihabitans sucicola TaxID=1268041 RepID=A0ABM8GQY3_9MICO|nr:NAD(P)H-binding protein [Frondihabitans sucicola]BDZ50711.1 NAD-dependent dehydratase [Frondihabitans sucicola]